MRISIVFLICIFLIPIAGFGFDPIDIGKKKGIENKQKSSLLEEVHNFSQNTINLPCAQGFKDGSQATQSPTLKQMSSSRGKKMKHNRDGFWLKVKPHTPFEKTIKIHQSQPPQEINDPNADIGVATIKKDGFNFDTHYYVFEVIDFGEQVKNNITGLSNDGIIVSSAAAQEVEKLYPLGSYPEVFSKGMLVAVIDSFDVSNKKDDIIRNKNIKRGKKLPLKKTYDDFDTCIPKELDRRSGVFDLYVEHYWNDNLFLWPSGFYPNLQKP